MRLLDPTRIRYVIIHCSASYYGDFELIEKWHLDRGFDAIGYHYLIGNGYPAYENWIDKRPLFWTDGWLWRGRSNKFQGAHVRGHNHESIGICLIGRRQFTQGQFNQAIAVIHNYLHNPKFPHLRGVNCIRGHYELLRGGNYSKTCPNIDMNQFRRQAGNALQKLDSVINRHSGTFESAEIT